VFEKKFPERKLDLFFLVESVGQALSSNADLLGSWKRPAAGASGPFEPVT